MVYKIVCFFLSFMLPSTLYCSFIVLDLLIVWWCASDPSNKHYLLTYLWSTKLKVLWKITPSSLADCTCSIPSIGLGKDHRRGWGLCRTISLVLWSLITIPLLSAHLCILPNSTAKSTSVFSGTRKLVSSAYLNLKYSRGHLP